MDKMTSILANIGIGGTGVGLSQLADVQLNTPTLDVAEAVKILVQVIIGIATLVQLFRKKRKTS